MTNTSRLELRSGAVAPPRANIDPIVRGRIGMAIVLTAVAIAIALTVAFVFGPVALVLVALPLPVPLILLWLSADVLRFDEIQGRQR